MTYDLLEYAPKPNVFYFRTKNPNAIKIYGCTRTMSKEGGFIYYFPCTYPAGIMALKNFKLLINGMATTEAIKKIEHLKSIPEKINKTELFNSLSLDLKRDPYPHQVETAEAMLHYNSLAVLLEQGMGKTYITILFAEALKQLMQQDIKLLVLAPRIVLRNWVREVTEFSNFEPTLYYGSIEQRLSQREVLANSNWDFFISNYETLVPTHLAYTKTGLTQWWVELSDEDRLGLITRWRTANLITDTSTDLHLLKYRKVKGEWKLVKKYLDYIYKLVKGIPYSQLLTAELQRKQRSLDDLQYIKGLSFNALIMDEGSRIKGYKSKRSNAVMQLVRDIPKKYILSGTLCLGNPTDVYMPMTLLDNNIFGHNYKQFEQQYAVYSPWNKHIIVEWKNLDKLKDKMDPYIIEKKREDCLYLPDQILTQRYYTLSAEQLDLYNQIITQDIVMLNGQAIDVSIPVVKLNKIRQVLSGHMILPFPRNDEKCVSCEYVVQCVEEDIYPWQTQCFIHDPNNKVPKPKREYYELASNPKADLLIEDLELTDEKTIIWAYYTYDVAQIEKLLTHHKVKYVTASTDNCDAIFEQDESCRVFLGQISQGIGITLNSATTTIYYSHDLGLEPRLQSIDRNMRIGQTKKVVVKDYLCEGTVEETIVALLAHKKDVKNFIQEKSECQQCEEFMKRCFKDNILPYSEKCILYENRRAAERKQTIKLKEISHDHA
jgi:SNF2 family DNA or RNA helicase